MMIRHWPTITLLLSCLVFHFAHSFQLPVCHRNIPFTNHYSLAKKSYTCSALRATPPQSPPSRRRRVWQWCQRKVGPLAVAMMFATTRPVQARTNEPTHSLRPGMTQTQAQMLEEGSWKASDLPTVLPEHTTSSPSTTTTKTTKSSLDYGDIEEDDDDDHDDDDFLLDQTTTTTIAPNVASTKRQFAAYHHHHQPNQHKGLTLKVGVAFFLPTYGTLIVREWYRRRREEAYVQKGLEILEAQKAEYFNISSSTQDSDVSDELKKLKNNETNAEDDEEDDDDDDEEDEPPRRRKDTPRKPSGDGGSPSSSGGGGGGSTDDKKDPGYGKPSDEDLDRLNKIFGKS